MEKKLLKDYTATDTLVEAMNVLGKQEEIHGPATGCMVIFLHRALDTDGTPYEFVGGFHNIPSHSTQLGVLEWAKIYFHNLGEDD